MKEKHVHQDPGLKCFWSLSPADALMKLRSSDQGLSAKEAAKRLKLYGPNSTQRSSHRAGTILFFTQFKSPIAILLILAALLSASLGDVTNSCIILVIVIISSILSFWQEKEASDAVSSLLKMVQIKTTVLRDGHEMLIASEKVAPGDVVKLSAGGIVPGDALLLDATSLFVDEAAFTGETFPAEKQPGIVGENSVISKRTNALFMGSHVVSGKGTALVISTGKRTEFGKISEHLRLREPETEFEKGTRKFGYLLMEITLILVIIIFGVNVYLHKPVLDSLLFSLALAVGLTPQLLPAIISVNLAAGAKKMAQKKVIVKKLSSIENFGGINVLCSDKTGTITEGVVKLKDAVDISGRSSEKVLQYAWLNAFFQKGFHNPIDVAIRSAYHHNRNYAFMGEIPYDFIRKRLTVAVSDDHDQIIITKGAVNNILAICDRIAITDDTVASMDAYFNGANELYQKLSNEGYRTLGVAYKDVQHGEALSKADEKDMIFLGFITLFDPPKPDITETISHLNDLGVQLKVITGDNALIAQNLAVKIGISNPQILTGSQLQHMSETALMRRAIHTHVFAEVEPNQKERIINALRKAGNVVGFMGDGINDASALHAADVGISVNSAVDVAKQAANIVLLDQNLDVLKDGIIAGRKTFINTMKYIFMATSANFGNMFSMAGASLFLPFLPLLPKQILLTNLLTDLPEMAISTDRVEGKNIQSPQRWDMNFIRRFMIMFGLLSSVFDYLTFGLLLLILHADEATFQTGWFTESVISAALIVLVIRTREPFMQSPPGRYLAIATTLLLLLVLALPYTAPAGWMCFVRLPLRFYTLVIPLIILYVISGEWIKQRFYSKAEKRLR